jgi:hypothetical protein
MILEGLVAASCAWGNTEACMAGIDSYAKYNGLDKRAELLEHNIKTKYPAAHFMGATVALIAQKKYTFMIYRNWWYEGRLHQRFG